MSVLGIFGIPFQKISILQVQTRKAYGGGKMAVRLSYIHNGISKTDMDPIVKIRQLSDYLVSSMGLHINGLAQDCGKSFANMLELLQSCTKLYRWNGIIIWYESQMVSQMASYFSLVDGFMQKGWCQASTSRLFCNKWDWWLSARLITSVYLQWSYCSLALTLYVLFYLQRT